MAEDPEQIEVEGKDEPCVENCAAAEDARPSPSQQPAGCMHKFRLYATLANFYMVGRNKRRTYWRVLKIDRLEPLELNIIEDPTTYSENECSELLRRIHEGNKSTGGLKFVTSCYGIVGFIKFLGPYYMVLITKRREIGVICGHPVYAISKSEIIALPNSNAQSTIANSGDENRYRKLLCTVDLTKDFFFSYSYNVMRSLQRNMCDHETGHTLYETMFVWNEYMTRGIRSHLQNTIWTVALVYGFFKQETLTVSGREFKFTLIARRSRHYAGTRYLKRGVNDKGRVANDVETEQIVFEDDPEGLPPQISSIVQNRGSIPLFWSQETSRLNIKPDIILSKRDQNYEATRLHFTNLMNRYGNPIIILNLIKTQEKKPRESILRTEFANAIDVINKDLPEESRLRFLHWDLHKHSRSKSTNVLLLLSKVAAYALTLTGFFHCLVEPSSKFEGSLTGPKLCSGNDGKDDEALNHCDNDGEDADSLYQKPYGSDDVTAMGRSAKPLMLQNGVLRTNCIDCLDRTNVAQYAYGLAALGRQLHALGVAKTPNIDLDAPLADDLMVFYERMGDTLAHQYGGSAAHNKIFSQRRGQWRAAIQSQEFLRTLQRYYSNTYMDAEKQDAINVFLGYFQPQKDKPALWELDSDQHYNSAKYRQKPIGDDGRSLFKRSLSDGNILHQNSSLGASSKQHNRSNLGWPQDSNGKLLVKSSSQVTNAESDYTYSRHTASTPHQQFLDHCDSDQTCISEHGDASSFSNFVDLDWLSSSGNSCEEELNDRSLVGYSPLAGMSSENVVSGIMGEATTSTSGYKSSFKAAEQSGTDISYESAHNPDVLEEYPDSFVQWVNFGETLCH
ncbi:unnamed protein product [Rhodiola kirilowii]